MDKFDLVPLFATPLAIIKVDEILFDKENLLKKCVFHDAAQRQTQTTVDDTNGSFSTLSGMPGSILNEYPYQKERLMSYFNTFKNNVLKLTSTEFKITTSWITKTIPGGFSELHNHKNSVFSAVFYFDDVTGGDIVFESMNTDYGSMLLNDPDEWGPYTARDWTYKPEKNTMIIFPSSVYHRVKLNNSNEDRYSMAINFFPTGKIGLNDSSIDLGN